MIWLKTRTPVAVGEMMLWYHLRWLAASSVLHCGTVRIVDLVYFSVSVGHVPAVLHPVLGGLQSVQSLH